MEFDPGIARLREPIKIEDLLASKAIA